MCGIVGIVGKKPVGQALYDALTVLQHRGQDAAGIVTWGENGLNVRKSNGLVRDVFHTRHMLRLTGHVGMGHIRYPTAGGSQSAEAQPFYVNSPYGICLAHNGNLTNYGELADLLTTTDRRHLSTSSDSEVLLNVFAHELQNRTNGRPTAEQIFDAVEAVHKRCSGGYAVVAMIIGHGIVAFRDPNGIRPICVGRRETDEGPEYMVASESVALDLLQFEKLRDIGPGETVFIENEGVMHSREYDGATSYSPCIFEFVYFARPDSIIDNLSVYKARLRMGEQLAGQIVREWPDHDIDVVIPIPDTSRTAAVPVAYHLGTKYREGFIKNRYIGRTFIMPGQEERAQSVRRKLNAIDLEFRGKNVLLVDDSIVRGTTSRQIIRMAREAGARKVYFASAAPPVRYPKRYPNVYGIDMPAVSELIAHGRSVEKIEELIGADRLIYQDLHGLIRSVRHDCFSGEYVTGDITDEYLRALEEQRSDSAKSKRDARYQMPDLELAEEPSDADTAVGM
jgi:amidophosphoribosyltransferase